MLYFVTLYMQEILHYSPIKAGAGYLPITAGFAVSGAISSQLVTRIGTRAVIVVGALLGAAGIFYLSRVPVDGSYVADVLPGMLVMALGMGGVFVAVTTAANAGVPASQAGLAAGLLNASQQLGSALGLAVLSAIAITRTNDLLAAHAARPDALAAGYHRGLLVGSLFMLAAAVTGLRTSNTRAAARSSSLPPTLRPSPSTSGRPGDAVGMALLPGQPAELPGQPADRVADELRADDETKNGHDYCVVMAHPVLEFGEHFLGPLAHGEVNHHR
jgi:MFS family permease